MVTIFVALALGGLLKGVIGMGAPVVAVPIMSVFVDVRLAVVVMVAPNLVTNLWQVWQYRHAALPGRFTLGIACASGAGAFVGTLFLVTFSADALSIGVAVAVLSYVGLRLAMPNKVLGQKAARNLAAPAGLLAGILQGAAGISAPVSVSFLNAMQLARPTFIFTISAMFVGMSLVQIPTLIGLGLLDQRSITLGAVCLVPLLVFMRIGAYLAQHISPWVFDRTILAMLVGLAARLIWSAVL